MKRGSSIPLYLMKLQLRAYCPSLPQPATERAAEDQPPPNQSQAPKSFQNSDLEAGSQARWSP